MTPWPPPFRRVLAGLSIAVVLPIVATRAADPPADAPLKEKGLQRSGLTYVLPAESAVQKQLNRARTLFRAANAAAQQKAQFDRDIQLGKAEAQRAEQQLLFLNQRLAAGQLATQEHNQVVGMINTLSLRLNQFRRQESDETRQVVGARLASGREEFLQAMADVRQLVDQTNAHYQALNADPVVKSTLDALNAAGNPKSKYALGPSRTYKENLELLARVESSVLSADVALRKEGGVYWVDATFNGKVTRSLVFDTGASTVVLPADLARSIGLEPGPADPVVTAQIADGSKVQAHKMVIPSLRVGKFTVANVECMVMPPGKANVPPLLGQTFQRNFSIKFNADAGKLSLTRVEDPDAESASAKGKAKASPSRPSTKARRSP